MHTPEDLTQADRRDAESTDARQEAVAEIEEVDCGELQQVVGAGEGTAIGLSK